jgi:hypothetical protein
MRELGLVQVVSGDSGTAPETAYLGMTVGRSIADRREALVSEVAKSDFMIEQVGDDETATVGRVDEAEDSSRKPRYVGHQGVSREPGCKAR